MATRRIVGERPFPAAATSDFRKAHYRLIDAVIRDNPGARILVTFGGGHKYKILERLRERRDIELVDLGPFPPR